MKFSLDLLKGLGSLAIEALILLAIGMVGIKILLTLERRALNRSRLDKSLHLFIIKATKFLLGVVLTIMVLQLVGVSTSSLVAVLGAGGAAIALALKDSLGNVAGGIIILITKPFKRGDYIEFTGSNAASGIVDSIDLLTTKLHTADNKVLSVPNGAITTSVIINHTNSHIRRVDCQFSIGYNDDIEKVKGILREVALSNDKILHEPEPVIGVASHGDNAVIMDLKAWCNTDDYYEMKYYLEEKVKMAFDEAGISIPFPQMDVHIKN